MVKTLADVVRVLMAPADAAGGSPSSAGAEGGTPPAANAGNDDVAQEVEEVREEPESADGDGRAASGDADTDDDEDDDYSDLDQNNPRIKTLVKRVKKATRYRQIADQLRGPGGRFLNAAELRRKADLYDQQATRRESPPAERQEKRQAEPTIEDQFEQFDPDHPATPILKQQHKTIATLTERLDKLEKGFSTRETETKVAAQQAEVQVWKDATESAARNVPKLIKLPGGGTFPLRQVFQDAVYGAYNVSRSRGMKLDVKNIITHYLKQSGLSSQQATRVAADAQRAAEHNKSLPRAAAVVPGRGNPTPAKTSKETVADVSRRLRGGRS